MVSKSDEYIIFMSDEILPEILFQFTKKNYFFKKNDGRKVISDYHQSNYLSQHRKVIGG